MTVPSTTRRAGPFTGTGALVAYPFEFKVFAKQDLAVTIADSNGLETDLVLDSTFTVTLNVDQEATPGGTVNYAVGGVAMALPSGYTLVVTGDGLEFEQTADLPQGGNFSPVVIENALDRVVMLLQRLWDGVRRSMRLPDTASDNVSTVLPVPTANNFIGWDSNATALRNVDPNTLATVVAFAAWQSQAFSGDGVTTQFTLSSDPGNVNNLDVVVGAVPQRNNVDFTLSGTTLTFDVAPANGLSIFCRWGQALPEGTSTLQTRLASTASVSDNDALVGRKRTAIGAIASNWHEWAEGQPLDAYADFGVIADDGTDNTAAFALITAYLSSVLTSSKQSIHLNTGVAQTDYFDLPSDCVIFGDGHGAVIKQRAGATRALIQPTDTTNGTHRVTLRNFCVDGNKSNQSASGSGLTTHGVSLEGPCTSWSLVGMKITNTRGHGLHTRGGGPTATSTKADDISVLGCWFKDCGNPAAGTDGRESMYCNRTQGLRIIGNLVEGSGRQSIALEGSGAQAIASRFNIISNNIIRNAVAGGIDDEANEGGDDVFTDNLIYNVAGAGIRVSGLTGNFMVSGNVILNAGSRGIDVEVKQLSYATNANIINNLVNGTGAEGINVNAGAYTTVADNNIRNAGTIGMYFRHTVSDIGAKIHRNTINGCAQEGMVLDRPSIGCTITENTIRNAGSLATPSPAYSIRGNTGAIESMVFTDNVCVEDRGTPYTTYAFVFSRLNKPIIIGNTVYGTTATNDVQWTGTASTLVQLGPNQWDWARVSGTPGSYRPLYNSNAALSLLEWDADAAPTLTISSNVITPTTRRAFLGAGLVKTIAAPIATGGGTITLIPTAAFTTDTTANIAIASTAVVGRAMTMTYDSGTNKWYPSY